MELVERRLFSEKHIEEASNVYEIDFRFNTAYAGKSNHLNRMDHPCEFKGAGFRVFLLPKAAEKVENRIIEKESKTQLRD
ncbi:hypothetical protein Asulf_01340 [Archaeoglobus sulfaticallidus PM70-1]|uniref:Uncharacterized protein n=2 Tax=Archaeoglobus TaxID=2233 RepID=N0BLB2_9EURY|nr:hypothetical protein Asulf_01340 [Archaeoglobus sulfaticallidus PM70-1]